MIHDGVPYRMIMRLAGLLVLLALCSACVSHQGRSDSFSAPQRVYDYRVIRDKIYTPDAWPEVLTADIYVPEARGPLPAVLVVHGGGWERGRTRSDMNEIAGQLAERGFVAVNISYRFAPAYQFPAQLHDLQQAMRWIHANADTYKIDADRIGGFGYSAGAHLITLLAMISDGDELDKPHGGKNTRLDAVVGGGTPSDLRKFDSGRLVRQFLGGTREDIPATYKRASPVAHITPDDPPTFLYHGGWDQLVPVDHAEDMYQALQQAGIESQLYINHGRGHVTMFLFSDDAVAMAIGFLYQQFNG